MATTSDTRRTQILLEAAHTFVRQGYNGTSMNELAERCSITKPGLYYHFKGKQDLLFAIMSVGPRRAREDDPRRHLRSDRVTRTGCATSCAPMHG